MNTIRNINDVVYQKFAISRTHTLVSGAVWILIFFFFNDLGYSIWNFLVELVLKEISTFELTLWNLVGTIGWVFICLITALLFFWFTYFPISIFIVCTMYLFIIFICLWILKYLNIIPKTLEKLLVYEQYKNSKLSKLYQLKDTKNFFRQNIINKVGKLDNYYLQYLISENTIEFVEFDCEFNLEKFNFKLSEDYSKLNFFLKYFGRSFVVFSLNNGCEHGFAEEIYCRHCFQKEKNKSELFRQFLKKYKAEVAKEKRIKEPKRNIISNADDLNLLNLKEPFTLDELKQRRNIALRENHPDLVSNMSKEVQNFAKTQTQKIIQAYKRLEKSAD